MNDNDVHLIKLECDNANAIDEKLLETLTKGLRAAVDADTKAVVLTGYDKFFSAGLNLKSLPEDRDGMASFVDSFEEAHLVQDFINTVTYSECRRRREELTVE